MLSMSHNNGGVNNCAGESTSKSPLDANDGDMDNLNHIPIM